MHVGFSGALRGLHSPPACLHAHGKSPGKQSAAASLQQTIRADKIIITFIAIRIQVITCVLLMRTVAICTSSSLLRLFSPDVASTCCAYVCGLKRLWEKMTEDSHAALFVTLTAAARCQNAWTQSFAKGDSGKKGYVTYFNTADVSTRHPPGPVASTTAKQEARHVRHNTRAAPNVYRRCTLKRVFSSSTRTCMHGGIRLCDMLPPLLTQL